jgi:hypothetical protein
LTGPLKGNGHDDADQCDAARHDQRLAEPTAAPSGASRDTRLCGYCDAGHPAIRLRFAVLVAGLLGLRFGVTVLAVRSFSSRVVPSSCDPGLEFGDVREHRIAFPAANAVNREPSGFLPAHHCSFVYAEEGCDVLPRAEWVARLLIGRSKPNGPPRGRTLSPASGAGKPIEASGFPEFAERATADTSRLSAIARNCPLLSVDETAASTQIAASAPGSERSFHLTGGRLGRRRAEWAVGALWECAGRERSQRLRARASLFGLP